MCSSLVGKMHAGSDEGSPGGSDIESPRPGKGDPPGPESSRPTTFQERYKVLEEVGHGSFGTVYRCHQLITGQAFAVKVVDLSKMKGRHPPRTHTPLAGGHFEAPKKLTEFGDPSWAALWIPPRHPLRGSSRRVRQKGLSINYVGRKLDFGPRPAPCQCA